MIRLRAREDSVTYTLKPNRRTREGLFVMNENVWKILIVDDEPEIHTVTKLVMSHETILGKKLNFLSAMNGDEARVILSENKDIAMVLLDVVMKTNNEGLGVAKWIREDLNNKLIRIVLRTGNPGDAPEMKVITGYEINDYKEKSELTSNKLRTLIYTSLRNYRDLTVLDHSRQGLERIVSSLSDLFAFSSLKDLLAGVMEQICSHLFLENGAVYGLCSGLSAFREVLSDDFQIIAATGDFKDKGTEILKELLPNGISGFPPIIFRLKKKTWKTIYTSDVSMRRIGELRF